MGTHMQIRTQTHTFTHIHTARPPIAAHFARYKDESYDLDLTYITDRIIAMGFPSSDFEVSQQRSLKL